MSGDVEVSARAPTATASSPIPASVIWICRIVIGMVLVAAGLAKISDPAAFAREIENFNALPIGTENVFAIVLPWIELIAGLSLVLGLRARSGAWFAAALMLIFSVAVLQAMARGLDISCGCFGTANAVKVDARKLIENLIFLGISAVGGMRMKAH